MYECQKSVKCHHCQIIQAWNLSMMSWSALYLFRTCLMNLWSRLKTYRLKLHVNILISIIKQLNKIYINRRQVYIRVKTTLGKQSMKKTRQFKTIGIQMEALGEQLSDTPVLTLHNTISVAILQTYSHCLFILPSPIFNKYLCRTDLSFDSHRTQITSGYHLFSFIS